MKSSRVNKRAEYRSRSSLLDALKDVQAGKGYLSEEDIRAIAKEYGMFPSEVYETATFYSMLHVGRKAEHVIEVCGSTCCDAGKAAELVSALEKELNIRCGETSGDGRWMLRRCECLGRCDTAPNAVVDGVLVTDARAQDIIDRIRKAGA